jgi:amino acid adenylation domain-containing protein
VTAQTQRTPDAVAVGSEDLVLTYAELDRLSNQIARRLASVGVLPGSRVAICVDRTPRMAAAVLGVLKAGAAYVPLDPEYPRDRLEYMLADSGATAVVTESVVAAAVPDGGAARVLLDDPSCPLTIEDHSAWRAAATPASVAYVLYTSGSTGRPKGVMVPHGAMVNLLTAVAREPGCSADDVLLSVTTLAFDIAGLEIFLPLLAGGRVVVAERADTLDGARLRHRLVQCGATMMQATPSTWRMLLDGGWDGVPPIRMITGGEAISRPFADALCARSPRLWNLYGPTETTIYSTGERVPLDGTPITIGRPLANTTLYVLDGAGERVPPGISAAPDWRTGI